MESLSTVDEVRQALASGQWVYFIGYARWVKVGTARRPRKRLAEFRVAVPFSLEFYEVIPGNAAVESCLHEKWRDARTQGEWFLVTREIRNFICKHARSENYYRDIALNEWKVPAAPNPQPRLRDVAISPCPPVPQRGYWPDYLDL